MKRSLVYPLVLGVFLVATALLLGHPHFNKSVTVKLPGGAEATIAYNTVPSNESHATNAAVGAFLTPRQPKLKLSADVKAGSVTIPAGEYVIGAIKNSNTDYTMGLYPGTIARGSAPDMSKMLKLESSYSSSEGKADHLLIDITPGKGRFEGRAILTLHFGSMFLAGALT
ncbi:MAG TPA: hypothetical protein VGK99_24160 [Acidobacteriota bacterium]|jgi:hypothetical protein